MIKESMFYSLQDVKSLEISITYIELIFLNLIPDYTLKLF